MLCFCRRRLCNPSGFSREHLKESYPHFHAVGHEGRYAAERFAFASKVSLRELVFRPPEKGLFGFYTAVCDFDDTPVRLVNVHLSPFLIERGSSILDAMDAMGRTEEKHTAEIRAICSTFDPASHAIVAGDFNSLSTFNASKRLAKFGLTDSFAAVHKDADTQATWYWETRLLPLKLRIDHIFHTWHFRTVQSQIVHRQGSDHSLVVSELRLVEQDDAPAAGADSNGE